MLKTKNIYMGIAGLLTLALLTVGVGLAFVTPQAAFAQGPAPTTPANPATPANPTTPANPVMPANPGVPSTQQRGQTVPPRNGVTPNTFNTYKDDFLNNFANRLGVPVEQVQQAIVGAANDTVDQAVQDGRLTQQQADQLKNQIANMQQQGILPGFLFPFGTHPYGEYGQFKQAPHSFYFGKGFTELNSFANALNLQTNQLISELQSGKTLAQIAQEQGVDLATVKTYVLSDLQARLNQAVQNGNLTQAQATTIYDQFNANFDNLVNMSLPVRVPGIYH